MNNEKVIEYIHSIFNRLNTVIPIIDFCKNRLNNIKRLNVLDYGVKNDGITDNTTILQNLIDTNKNITFYFPEGTYIFSQIIPKENMIIVGDGILKTIFKQKNNSNKDFIYSEKCTGLTIKDISIDGNKLHNTNGCALHFKGADSNHFNNGISIKNVRIDNASLDGIRISGCNVENTFTNILINNSGRYGFYNEGHDLIMSNSRIQRSRDSNIIYMGNNGCIQNVQSIYSNMAQKNTDKNSSDLKYGIILKGARNLYNNIDCQDSFGHGVLFEDCTDSIFCGTVDSVGINRDETEWSQPNNPNNCIGFNIKNSKITIYGNVTNWHNNNQGASYIVDYSSTLTGNITRNEMYVKEPIINSCDILENKKIINDLFSNMSNIFNNVKIEGWSGATINHGGTGDLVYSSGRYGQGVSLVSIDNIGLDTTNYITDKTDFEYSFTYTPLADIDANNTRWILYNGIGNSLIQVVKSTEGKFVIFYACGSEAYSLTCDDIITKGFPYRFFIKVKGKQLKIRIYKYSLLIFNQCINLTASINGSNNVIYLGNKDIPQLYWSGQGVFEDLWIGKAIPDELDYKQLDERIKINPYTTFKANIDGNLS